MKDGAVVGYLAVKSLVEMGLLRLVGDDLE